MTAVNTLGVGDERGRGSASASRRRRAFLRSLLWTRKGAGAGVVIVAMLVIAAAAAPLLAPFDPAAQDLLHRYAPPSSQHLMGTDSFGRDILSRVIWGTKISLFVGVAVVLIAAAAGGALGVGAGYIGGPLDRGITFFVEMLMAFPLLLLALAFISVLGPGLINLVMAIALGSIPMFAQVLRAETCAIREHEYVVAARSIGASHLRIVLTCILPNIMASLIVLATARVGTAILAEASLSFLGLGIRPPTPSWGGMVAQGQSFLEQAPWIALAPGGIIMIALLSFNLVGDGLRDALDVRLGSTGK